MPDCNAVEFFLKAGVVFVHHVASNVDPVGSCAVGLFDESQRVRDLELKHQDNRVSAVGVGPVEREEVGKATGRHTEVGFGAIFPGVVDRQAISSGEVDDADILLRFEAGCQHDRIDFALVTIRGNDTV